MTSSVDKLLQVEKVVILCLEQYRACCQTCLCPTEKSTFGIQNEKTSKNREVRRGGPHSYEHPNFTEMQFTLCIPFLTVTSKSKGLFWAARISGERCSSRRVQRVIPVANLSRTHPSALLLTLGPPQTGAPAPVPDESPFERNSNSP